MKFLSLACVSTTVVIFGLTSGTALALPSECSVMGVVSGGGMYDGQNSDVSLGAPTQTKATSNWKSAFGEGALGISCNAVNIQADAALFAFWASKSVPTIPTNTDVSLSAFQGHIGGATFWRNPSNYSLGVSGSWINQSYDASSTPAAFTGNGNGNLWRAGGFAEYYANESFTLAGSAHYFTGSLPLGVALTGVQVDQFGLELAAIAKFYPTNDIAITARADILRSQLRIANTANFDFNGYAFSLEGEYLMPDTQFSMFAGARYADRLVSLHPPVHIDLQDTQAYIGLKYAFGGTHSGSIASRDRSGTYDNTSVFLEKLPNLAGSVDNTIVNAAPITP